MHAIVQRIQLLQVTSVCQVHLHTSRAALHLTLCDVHAATTRARFGAGVSTALGSTRIGTTPSIGGSTRIGAASAALPVACRLSLTDVLLHAVAMLCLVVLLSRNQLACA